ncbi:MAG: glycosyltransferase family 2 protein [Opitutaceae bacterium]|nr:glycosyltransferase family 2 protein [Opitutaceae bacterium]
MALVHVFVPTYRRAHLLKRALQSLRAQTFPDWTAVVHNDEPSDPEPGRIVADAGDARIRLLAHESNLGAVAAFNRGFQEVPESATFLSILEDDSTWQPGFLATLKHALERNPTAHLAWCNQRISLENPDGSWRDTDRTVHPCGSGTRMPDEFTLVPWGALSQATGARMANGAMLIRRSSLPPPTPEDLPFSGMEAFRERLIQHPFVYVPEPLATYAQTQVSARDADGHRWGEIQTLLLATFVRNSGMNVAGIRTFWSHLREQSPPPTNLALHAAIGDPSCRRLLRGATLRDWLRYFRTWIGHPHAAWACVRARKRHPVWWRMLDTATSGRFHEERERLAGGQQS